jgi:chromosome segregation ATPase
MEDAPIEDPATAFSVTRKFPARFMVNNQSGTSSPRSVRILSEEEDNLDEEDGVSSRSAAEEDEAEAVLREELERKDERIAELEKIVKKLRERMPNREKVEMENLKRRLKNSEEEIEDLKTAVLRADETVEELQQAREECERLKRQVEGLLEFKEKAEELEAEVRRLRAGENRTEVSAMRSELEALRDENALLKNELKSGRRTGRGVEPTPLIARGSRIPIGPRMTRFSEPRERSPKGSDDEMLTRRSPPCPVPPLPWMDTDERPSAKPILPPRPPTPAEMTARVDELILERAEIERQLCKALPKEKGAVLARLRQEREQLELRLEEVTREIAKFKLDIRLAGKTEL